MFIGFSMIFHEPYVGGPLKSLNPPHMWVRVKIRYPKKIGWLITVNTKLDFHICGLLGLPY